MTPHIQIINACSVLTDAQIAAMVAALQIQVTRDFAPLWGQDAQLDFAPKGHKPDPAAWWISVLNTSDEAGALGYHDLTTAGLPLGKVFAKTDLQYKSAVSVTLSHELLEMLGDPWINAVVERQVNGRSLFYAYEASDAVEADELGYQINGIQVSDFVTPAWFQPFKHAKATAFSFGKHVSQPFQLAKGGYASVYDPTKGGWKQLTAQTAPGGTHFMTPELAESLPMEARARVGSRRERRRLGACHWLRSVVETA